MFMLLLKCVRTALNSGNSFFLECYKTIQGKVIYIYLLLFSLTMSQWPLVLSFPLLGWEQRGSQWLQDGRLFVSLLEILRN